MVEVLLLSANSFNKRLASHMTKDMKLTGQEALPEIPDHRMRSHCRNYSYIGSHQISPVIGNNDPFYILIQAEKKGTQNEIQRLNRCSALEAMQFEYHGIFLSFLRYQGENMACNTEDYFIKKHFKIVSTSQQSAFLVICVT